MVYHLARRERFHAQAMLFAAIALQIAVWKINHQLLVGPQYLIIPAEIFLAIVIGLTTNVTSLRRVGLRHVVATVFLCLISIANATSLALVLQSLIIGHSTASGSELLVSALAIFGTNIIVYALWYWEIDSPGLTGRRWSKHDQDFQFTQQDLKRDFGSWRPEFLDYLYVSVTNAINFAPSDARPLTHIAKLLMGSQALISIFTLALVIARSVSILGT